MNRSQGKNTSGRSGGRSSDKNKDAFSQGPRGPKRAGSGDKPFKKSFDDAQKKPYGKTGDGKPAKSGPKSPVKKDDAPKRAVRGSERPSFGGKAAGDRKFADKPAGRGPAKGSYKDFAEKGKTDRPKFSDKPARSTERPAKSFKDKPDGAKTARPRLDGPKKTPSKYQKRKENLGLEAAKKSLEAGLPQAGIRLNKFIANSGMCSRREADVMIQNGVVMVNDKILDEVGYRVQPNDVVKFDGRTIIPEKPVYLLLNKPKDYITTSEDPQGRKTVMALIQGACKERVFPVGRLDRNTTGLLLFTNDGEIADKLMHPRKRVKKIYMVELDKNFKHEHLLQLRDGVTLEDGPIKPDVIEYADGPKPDKKIVGVEIHSGRNRIVRRMFEHFGYNVIKLDRVYYAGLTKKNLPRGHYRMLEPIEVNMLKML